MRVPQSVEADPRKVRRLDEAFEGSRDRVQVEDRPVLGAEHQAGIHPNRSRSHPFLALAAAMVPQDLDRSHVQGVRHGESVLVKIDVPPCQTQKFAPAHPCRSGEHPE